MRYGLEVTGVILFCIDDLNELADAYGIERDDPHIQLNG